MDHNCPLDSSNKNTKGGHEEVEEEEFECSGGSEELGLDEEAEPLYIKSLGIAEKGWGKGHPTTKKIQENYNDLKKKMNRRYD